MKRFNKILVSNRGEIACRILGTLKRLGIMGVVAYHPVDDGTPAVRMADEAVEIDGPTPVAAYLDTDQIVTACKDAGADAVHPGFGFLAENAGFARRLAQEGITFVGPLPETIELMGNKVAARTFCLENGFPLAPSVTERDTGGHFERRAAELGFPLLIKAAAGGGGKGMVIAGSQTDLPASIRRAKGEALRAFGDDSIYAERCLEAPRHIEVQILADHHGTVVDLGERECSIQRRFQKIIEESPAPDLSDDLRRRICRTARDIALKAGYRNAGTVEFLLEPDGAFYFLEMNTRLQVEHPVTEMVTGLDLVELQIRIASGEPLTLKPQHTESAGHAIEARLYAEDPENDFHPATGKLFIYEMPSGHGIRVENGYAPGMRVTSAFDPMLAKVIACGDTRQSAVKRLIKALGDTRIMGVTTNADYLCRILSHPQFEAGHTDTGFIPRFQKELHPPRLTKVQQNLLLAAAALASPDLTDPAMRAPEPYASMGSWRN